MAARFRVYYKSQQYVTRTNLIPNPSFEVDTSGWVANNCAIAISSVWASTGSYSLRTAPNTASADSSAQITTTAAALGIAGKTVTLSATVYVPVALSGTLDGADTRAMQIFWQRASTGSTFHSVRSAQGSVTGQTRLSVSANIPSDATTVLIRLNNGATNSASNFVYWDSVLLEESSSAGSYFDGTVNDLPSNEFAVAQGWNGTANASTSFLTYGTEYEISNVFGVNCNVGRRAPLDAYRANTASVEIRYPSGYATPNPDFIPGTEIRINTVNNASEQQVFRGEIADVKVTYGKPYASSTGPADILTLSCESYFATMGRTQGNGYVLAADDLNAQCNDLFANFGFDIVTPGGFGAETLFAATTLNGTIADWVNLVALSMNGRIQDAGPSFGLIIFNQYFKPANFLGDFSDDGTVGTNRYTEITFDSLADNYYTQVTVDPESFAEQTVQTGSAPYRSYKVNTLNASTGQALDYANYLLSTYQDPQLAISSFRVFIDDQSGNPTFGCTDLGTAVSVKFRGTTYNCIIEGATFSGSPDRGVYATYYVSGQDLNNYLLLDNAVYGRLDFNKLGY